MSEWVESYREVDIMRYPIGEGVFQYYFIHDGERSRDLNSLGEARFVVGEILDKLEDEG